jgi:hypothetical protein
MGICIFEKNNPYCMRYIKTNASGRYANIKLYDIFRKDLRLPDAKAQELVQALNESARESQDDLLRDLATKESVNDNSNALKAEFCTFKDDITGEFHTLRKEFHSFKDDMTGEFHTLRKEFHSFKDDMTGEFHTLRKEFHCFKDDMTGGFHTLRRDFHGLELSVAETKTDLTRSIFWTGLVQFLAIIGSAIGIISFMLRK